MRWLRRSLILQIALALYFQLVLWIPLGGWNNQPGERFIAILANGKASVGDFCLVIAFLLPVLVFALAYSRRMVWLLGVGLIGYGAWAITQIQSWWIPYMFGADQRALFNQQALSRTTRLLPSFPDHPAPDGLHLVLDLPLFAVVGSLSLGLAELAAHARAKRVGKRP
jgi:hypothetical protein